MGRLIMILVDTTVIIDIWRGKPQVKTLLKHYKDHSNTIIHHEGHIEIII